MTEGRSAAVILILVGAAIIASSLVWAMRTRTLVVPTLRRKWTFLLFLMGFFVIGYCAVVAALLSKMPLSLDLFMGLVFFGGACFVFVVMKLSNTSIRTLEEKEAEAKKYLGELIQRTDDLEKEIAERYRVEDDFSASERFLASVFQSINDPFCVFDASFRIVQANEQYASLKNRSVQDLVGSVCYEHEGRTAPCEDCLVEKTIRSKDPCAKQKSVGGPGAEEWLELFTYPVLDDRGAVSHVIEYTRDITDRKLMERERQGMMDRLSYLSRTDALTGLLNRRGLVERLEQEMERVRRHSGNLSVIIGDVDTFKGVNDTYGHAVGDRALTCVADVVKSFLRKSDIAGRYGGDEFMIILPETDPRGGQKFAERIREKIARTRVATDDETDLSISMSLGVAGYDETMGGVDDIIVPADKALYASKEQGKNRVTIYCKRD